MHRAKPSIHRRLAPAALCVLIALPSSTYAQAAPAEAASSAAECRILGRVLDADTDEGIAGASLWLERSADGAFVAGRQTSADGSFAIETAICEPAILRVTMIGYLEAEVPIDPGGPDRTQAVTVRLERDPVELDVLVVEVPRSTRLADVGFYARKAWIESLEEDMGQLYDLEEVEARTPRTVGALISGSRIRGLYGGPCPPAIFIDGIWFRSDSAALRMLDYGIRPWEVEGVEIYRAVHGAVPEEFRNPISNVCGAAVVWTKIAEPAEPPQIEVELCEPSDDPDGISFGGVITDELTGVPLPASYVTLTILGEGTNDQEVETIANEDGRYRYCDLGTWPSSVQARYGSTIAEPFEIDGSRAAPGYWEVDLKLAVVRTGSVVGAVVGLEPGAEVEVALDDTPHTASLDDDGYFEIHDVMPDDYSLVVRRGEDVLLRREVSIRSAATETVTLDLDVP
ncbi:MAG: carboxypeptidase-like regulatory domain-containing protein [Gemmatimonadota bacterium]|nr:carboxypeptidase-like regulatory domain-containing protein [Gemmatimonadota bacterium]